MSEIYYTVISLVCFICENVLVSRNDISKVEVVEIRMMSFNSSDMLKDKLGSVKHTKDL